MKASFKVTLLIALLAMLIISLDGLGQQIVPVKTGDVWAYQNESSGAVLYTNLEKAEPFRNGVGIARKNGKWGALDLSMKEIVAFEYEEMEMILPTVIRGFKNKRYTLYGPDGEQLVTNLSNALSAEVIPEAVIISDENRKFGMISSDGKTVIPMKYARAPEVVNENKLLLFLEKNKKFYQGILDEKGKELVPFEYYSIRYREDGYYVGMDEKRNYHFHNVLGEEMFVGKSNSVRFFGESYITERFENKAILHSVSSKKKVTYDVVLEFEELLIGIDSTKTTVYSTDGKPFTHKGMWRPQERRDDCLLMFEYESNPRNYEIWNEKGKVIFDGQFSNVVGWNEKWIVVNAPEHQRKQVLIDIEKNKQVGVYDKVELLSCNNLRILNDGKTQLFNEELKELSQSEVNKKSVYINLSEADLQRVRREYFNSTKQNFDDAGAGDEDCGARDLKEVKVNNLRLLNDRYGRNPLPNRLIVEYWEQDKRTSALINFEGKVIAQGAFGFSSWHMEELIQFVSYEKLDVGSIGRSGFMDVNGMIILPARYDKIEELKGDTAVVVLHGLWSIINIRTDEVILSDYHGIRSLNNGFYSIRKNADQGIADAKGKVIVPAIYEKVAFPTDGSGLFEVERNKQKFYVDQNGNEIPRE